MTLADSQAALAELLRRPEPLPADDPRALAIAAGSARLSPVEQVDVYREQFFLRHVDVLREDFSTIAHYLGDDAFEALAKDYLAKHPPSSFTLRDLGHAFPSFVAHDPVLSDLARLEWAFVTAFDAKDVPPFDTATIANVPEDAWPHARIVFHPALQLVATDVAAQDYRAAVKEGNAPQRPEARKCWIVVYRGEDKLKYMDVDRDAYELLVSLARGTALGEACEEAARRSQADLAVFQEKLGGWFALWTSRGWIASVTFPAAASASPRGSSSGGS